MELIKGIDTKLTSTLSLLYVQDRENSLCPDRAMCIWEGSITPVIRVCLKSSCGCSGDFCESVSMQLTGGYINEWRIQILGLELVLTNVSADGRSLKFNFMIEGGI